MAIPCVERLTNQFFFHDLFFNALPIHSLLPLRSCVCSVHILPWWWHCIFWFNFVSLKTVLGLRVSGTSTVHLGFGYSKSAVCFNVTISGLVSLLPLWTHLRTTSMLDSSADWCFCLHFFLLFYFTVTIFLYICLHLWLLWFLSVDFDHFLELTVVHGVDGFFVLFLSYNFTLVLFRLYRFTRFFYFFFLSYLHLHFKYFL